jgi:hypothetical protein
MENKYIRKYTEILGSGQPEIKGKFVPVLN